MLQYEPDPKLYTVATPRRDSAHQCTATAWPTDEPFVILRFKGRSSTLENSSVWLQPCNIIHKCGPGWKNCSLRCCIAYSAPNHPSLHKQCVEVIDQPFVNTWANRRYIIVVIVRIYTHTINPFSKTKHAAMHYQSFPQPIPQKFTSWAWRPAGSGDSVSPGAPSPPSTSWSYAISPCALWPSPTPCRAWPSPDRSFNWSTAYICCDVELRNHTIIEHTSRKELSDNTKTKIRQRTLTTQAKTNIN